MEQQQQQRPVYVQSRCYCCYTLVAARALFGCIMRGWMCITYMYSEALWVHGFSQLDGSYEARARAEAADKSSSEAFDVITDEPRMRIAMS